MPDSARFAIIALPWICLLQGASAQIPESLDDRAFWSLVVDLSESDGEFADDNFVSNELGLERLLPDLERTLAPSEVYIGVGPEQNFSYIAALQPAIAFIVDIRRQNAMEHLLYKALFEISETRAEFVTRLFSRSGVAELDMDATSDELLGAVRNAPGDRALFERTLASIYRVLRGEHGFELSDSDRASILRVFEAFYAGGPDLAYVFQESDDWHPNYIQLMDLSDASGTNWSYLGSEAAYRRVRDLQRRNLIVPVVGDFAGPKALRAIGAFAEEHEASVDVFYVSNVEPYLFESNLWRPFYENLAAMPIDGRSLIVRTFFGSTSRACPSARVSRRVPLTESISELVSSYRDGAIQSQCDLVARSR